MTRDARPRVVHVARASAVGASHRARGLTGDDAVGYRVLDGVGVAAVADGHSDPRCVRAREGADLAVAGALDSGAEAEADFGPAIVRRWRSAVDARCRSGDGLTRLAFGTTLLACRADAAGLAIVQVGDGDVVLVDRDGRARRPLGDVERPPSDGATASLADDDVLERVAGTTIRPGRLPHVVLLSSDGVDNAYPRPQALLEAAEEIAARRDLLDPVALQAELDGWVAGAAAASGDDATVLVLVLDEDRR